MHRQVVLQLHCRQIFQLQNMHELYTIQIASNLSWFLDFILIPIQCGCTTKSQFGSICFTSLKRQNSIPNCNTKNKHIAFYPSIVCKVSPVIFCWFLNSIFSNSFSFFGGITCFSMTFIFFIVVFPVDRLLEFFQCIDNSWSVGHTHNGHCFNLEIHKNKISSKIKGSGQKQKEWWIEKMWQVEMLPFT